jgi:hypothetical protein
MLYKVYVFQNKVLCFSAGFAVNKKQTNLFSKE